MPFVSHNLLILFSDAYFPVKKTHNQAALADNIEIILFSATCNSERRKVAMFFCKSPTCYFMVNATLSIAFIFFLMDFMIINVRRDT